MKPKPEAPMNEKKPLSQEVRVEIERVLKLKQGGHVLCDDLLRAALDAADFWREAVMTQEPAEYYGMNDGKRCFFCGTDFYDTDGHTAEAPNGRRLHTDECPWILAQETK